MTRANRPWSPAEVQALHDNTHLTPTEMAALLGRSLHGVWCACRRQKVRLAETIRPVKLTIPDWPLCVIPDLRAGMPVRDIAAKFDVALTAVKHHISRNSEIRAAFDEGKAVRRVIDDARRKVAHDASAYVIKMKAIAVEGKAAKVVAKARAKQERAAKPKPVRRKGTGGWRGGAKPTSFRDERVIGDADIAATYLRQLRYIPVIADASKIYGRALAGQSIVGRLKMPVQDMIAKAVGLGLQL
jgi:hypothetical protein